MQPKPVPDQSGTMPPLDYRAMFWIALDALHAIRWGLTTPDIDPAMRVANCQGAMSVWLSRLPLPEPPDEAGWPTAGPCSCSHGDDKQHEAGG